MHRLLSPIPWSLVLFACTTLANPPAVQHGRCSKDADCATGFVCRTSDGGHACVERDASHSDAGPNFDAEPSSCEPEGVNAIAKLGAACDCKGEVRCAAHASRDRLQCNGKAWVAVEPRCSGNDRCDTNPNSSSVTKCVPVAALCARKQPHDVICAGTARGECGDDLITIEDRGACEHGECSETDEGAFCECESGYLPTGANGTCRPISCGSEPPAPAHGLFQNKTGTTFGSSASYSCENGYEPATSTIKCQDNGRWEDVRACTKGAICGEDYCTNGTCHDSACQCNSGYEAVAQSGRTTCVPVACGEPPAAPQHGALIASTGVAFGQTATYACHGGYEPSSITITCGANKQWDAVPRCNSLPSCTNLPAKCGFNHDDTCCDNATVEGGRFFVRGDTANEEEVSTFRLDTYEVSVGRFREFVSTGPSSRANAPQTGSGKSPNNTNGWDAAWNVWLAADQAGLQQALNCEGNYATFPRENDLRPINCVTWYEAYAFCAWDGGYLPTYLQWHYAATGGAQQRRYPWSKPADSPTVGSDYASYGDGNGHCYGDDDSGCAYTDLVEVGVKAAGAGRWGHHDLGGNVFEWIADNAGPSPANAVLGGAYLYATDAMATSATYLQPSDSRSSYVGFRCARMQ